MIYRAWSLWEWSHHDKPLTRSAFVQLSFLFCFFAYLPIYTICVLWFCIIVYLSESRNHSLVNVCTIIICKYISIVFVSNFYYDCSYPILLGCARCEIAQTWRSYTRNYPQVSSNSTQCSNSLKRGNRFRSCIIFISLHCNIYILFQDLFYAITNTRWCKWGLKMGKW